MDFSVDLLHGMEKDINLEIQKVLKAVNVTSAADLNENVLLKLNKNPLTNIILRLVDLFEKNLNTCKSAASKIDQLKSDQIENQKKLLEVQQEKMDSVQKTVKTELKSWANIVKKNCNPKQPSTLTTKSVKDAVRSVNDEEKRSKNFIIYGYKENEEGDEGNPSAIAHDVYDKAGFQLPEILDVNRIGKKTPGKTRPVKVELTHPTDVQIILNHAYKLKTTDLSSVYLAPDRTKDERVAHGKLVAQMKAMIEQDSGKHYFIRNNKINSVDKTLSPESE